jgi:hypothetical protein
VAYGMRTQILVKTAELFFSLSMPALVVWKYLDGQICRAGNDVGLEYHYCF